MVDEAQQRGFDRRPEDYGSNLSDHFLIQINKTDVYTVVYSEMKKFNLKTSEVENLKTFMNTRYPKSGVINIRHLIFIYVNYYGIYVYNTLSKKDKFLPDKNLLCGSTVAIKKRYIYGLIKNGIARLDILRLKDGWNKLQIENLPSIHTS